MMKFFLILIIILAVVLLFLKIMFPFVFVDGDSMLPTLKNGDILISRRVSKRHKFVTGDVYVYSPPTNSRIRVIKRLSHSTQEGLYFTGDNKSCSYDSRYYGYVQPQFVFSKVIRKCGNKNELK